MDESNRREFLRLSAAALLPMAVATATGAHDARLSVSDLTLPTLYGPHIDPARCLVSEKYDGVRAFWDGTTLRHRSGRAVSVPAWFTAALPGVPLDGELWLGRGRFDALSAIVRKAVPDDASWRDVRYLVFEMPHADGSFTERAAAIRAAVAQSHAPFLHAAPQVMGTDRVALQRLLDETVAGGGEGLMLHLASAPYESGRSDTLVKLKPHLDAEAVVVDHRPGRGKYEGQLGALQVQSPEGRRFFIGSGLPDDLRRTPPAAGTVVTYRYRDVTPNGTPRFATFVRIHEAL